MSNFEANHDEEALDLIRKREHWHTKTIGGTESEEPLSGVLMDLEMPMMDRTTCLKKIRQSQYLGKICCFCHCCYG